MRGPGIVPGSWRPGSTLADFVDGRLFGTFSSEGLLSSVQSAVNVVGGALIGFRLRERPDPRATEPFLLKWAAAGIVAGLLLAPAVPVVKRLWTPSYVVLSHGVCCAFLAAASRVTRSRAVLPIVRPLEVMGSNPLAVYVALTTVAALAAPLRPAIVQPIVEAAGASFGAMEYALTAVAGGWALAAWLHRRRLFLRI